jgi:hypothetical protein
MLIIIAGLAGLLSFGSASMLEGITGNEAPQEERIIAHTIGSVEIIETDETVTQEQPQTDANLPMQAEGPK